MAIENRTRPVHRTDCCCKQLGTHKSIHQMPAGASKSGKGTERGRKDVGWDGRVMGGGGGQEWSKFSSSGTQT